MSNHEPFLEEIIANPDDDTPRLIYADWLEEQGDPRSEFIRVQCTLENLPTTHPDYPELKERESLLLHQYGFDWARELDVTFSHWEFRRGFIESVELGFNSEAMLELLQKTPLRNLRDTYFVFSFKFYLEVLPHLEDLRGLEFWELSSPLNEQLLTMLKSPFLRNLRRLVLHCDRNGGMVDDNTLVEILMHPYRERIEELAVNVDSTSHGPSRSVVQAIAKSPYLRNLKKLNLSHLGEGRDQSGLDMETFDLLRQSKNFQNIEELDLRWTRLPDNMWRELLTLPWIQNLKRVFMAGTMIEHQPELRSAWERVATIDWDTDYGLLPWDGISWQGQSWEDCERKAMFEMNDYLLIGDLEELEAEYHRRSHEQCDPEFTARIQALSFDEFEQNLHSGFQQAIEMLNTDGGTSIYLRFHMSQSDRTDFSFILYASEQLLRKDIPGTDHHYPGGEIVGGFDGPDFPDPELSYGDCPADFYNGPSSGRVYLHARTLAAVARCVRNYHVPVPIYYTCGNTVFLMPQMTTD